MTDTISHTVKSIMKAIGLILGVIGLLTTFYYIIIDRSNVIAQVNNNSKDIRGIQVDIDKIKNQKNSFDDLKYNLKRLMEKQGLVWQPFNERTQ